MCVCVCVSHVFSLSITPVPFGFDGIAQMPKPAIEVWFLPESDAVMMQSAHTFFLNGPLFMVIVEPNETME